MELRSFWENRTTQETEKYFGSQTSNHQRQNIHSLFPGCSVQRAVTRECLLLKIKKEAHQSSSFPHHLLRRFFFPQRKAEAHPNYLLLLSARISQLLLAAEGAGVWLWGLKRADKSCSGGCCRGQTGPAEHQGVWRFLMSEVDAGVVLQGVEIGGDLGVPELNGSGSGVVGGGARSLVFIYPLTYDMEKKGGIKSQASESPKAEHSQFLPGLQCAKGGNRSFCYWSQGRILTYLEVFCSATKEHSIHIGGGLSVCKTHLLSLTFPSWYTVYQLGNQPGTKLVCSVPYTVYQLSNRTYCQTCTLCTSLATRISIEKVHTANFTGDAGKFPYVNNPSVPVWQPASWYTVYHFSDIIVDIWTENLRVITKQIHSILVFLSMVYASRAPTSCRFTTLYIIEGYCMYSCGQMLMYGILIKGEEVMIQILLVETEKNLPSTNHDLCSSKQHTAYNVIVFFFLAEYLFVFIALDNLSERWMLVLAQYRCWKCSPGACVIYMYMCPEPSEERKKKIHQGNNTKPHSHKSRVNDAILVGRQERKQSDPRSLSTGTLIFKASLSHSHSIMSPLISSPNSSKSNSTILVDRRCASRPLQSSKTVSYTHTAIAVSVLASLVHYEIGSKQGGGGMKKV
ncbi:hypothetical protein VP01_747g2 [Puccinia sorghi]|uniref:Uncharacterized protein n=1 Tax=Puccinia sorghi TaxID=27349 RepID=A0A0L6UCD4_9BASI|nr:hypothetical protein VP01_747g2 [Puccinia sorghi]